MLACVVTFIFAGCDRQARHKVLTFFFEGVPPLDSSRRVVQTEDGGITVYEGQEVVFDEQAIRKLAQNQGSKHESVGECNKCHIGGTSTGQRKMAKPLPDLCYSCHEKFETLSGFPHGPIVVGDCVFCHDAHQSRYVNLQKAPQPELCYLCHRSEDMSDIIEHQEKEKIICTDCHDPHTGTTMMRLKSTEETKSDPNIVESSK
jgi:predicted CXXCH cytochrome family protein